MSAAAKYVKNIVDSVKTTWVGMKITGKYLLQKPITVQYPDERLPIPNRYRGIHYLEQEKCIECLACARACPIDCIEMDAIRHGKELEWISFTLDYQKCMFCELCVYPCPKDCIHMGTEYAFVSFDRSEFKHDLLSYKGMARDAKARMIEAEKKKQAKEEAKKAKEASLAAAAAEAEGSSTAAAAKGLTPDEPAAGKTPDRMPDAPPDVSADAPGDASGDVSGDVSADASGEDEGEAR